MAENIFTGKLVRLGTEEPEALAQAAVRWDRDSEYIRLLNYEPASLWSVKKFKEWIEKDQDREYFSFNIRTLDGDRLIGFVGLGGLAWNHGEAWVGIGLGERNDWDKGYGTEAMRLLLRYAFTELNLRRVSLGVFEYNPRAVRSYEKAGFRVEGRQRKELNREGRRWDTILMGILREEWEENVKRET
jgi:RimJ/RimL family protein N-acetyltransferase